MDSGQWLPCYIQGGAQEVHIWPRVPPGCQRASGSPKSLPGCDLPLWWGHRQVHLSVRVWWRRTRLDGARHGGHRAHQSTFLAPCVENFLWIWCGKGIEGGAIEVLTDTDGHE